MKKQWNRGLGMLCCLALLMTGCGASSGETAGEAVSESETSLIQEETTISEAEERLRHAAAGTPASEKEETVSASAYADGTVYDTTVTVKLIADGDSDIVSDLTNLQDLRNIEGSEEFVQIAQGEYLWEYLGDDIEYEGVTTQALPVSVKFTFTLDGQSILPEDLVGKSGHVVIRIDYENLESRQVEIDGMLVDTVVPFTAMTAVLLDEEKFSNVEVTNGRLTELSDLQMVVGYAMPGVADVLGLDDMDLDAFEDLGDKDEKDQEDETEEDFEVPSYVEIEADVTDFSLEFTETIVTPGIASEMDHNALDNMVSFLEGMTDLGDASREIQDGFGDLEDGVATIYNSYGQYNQGVGQLYEGALGVKSAMSQILEAGGGLETGAAGIAQGLDALEEALAGAGSDEELDLTGLQNMAAALGSIGTDVTHLMVGAGQLQEAYAALTTYHAEAAAYEASVAALAQSAGNQLDALNLSELPEDQQSAILSAIAGAKSDISGILSASLPAMPTYAVDVQLLTDAAADLTNQVQALATEAAALETALSGLSEAATQLGELQTGIASLSTYADQLSSGILGYNQALSRLYDEGITSLAEGSAVLASSGDAFVSGLRQLRSAVANFGDGYAEFDEEGIKKLADMGNSDAILLLRRLHALQEADASYDNFTGKYEGQESSVIFLIETDSIE